MFNGARKALAFARRFSKNRLGVDPMEAIQGLIAVAIGLVILGLIVASIFPTTMTQMSSTIPGASTGVSSVWSFLPILFILALVLGVLAVALGLFRVYTHRSKM